MKSTDPPVIVEQDYNATVEQLWGAITEPDQMKQWFFEEMESFEPSLGFETQFSIEHNEKVYVHQWKIVEVIDKEKIVYDWRYEGIPGVGNVSWELTATDSGAKLTLTNSVLESFPQDDPAFKRESAEAGWEYFVNGQLKSHLENGA